MTVVLTMSSNEPIQADGSVRWRPAEDEYDGPCSCFHWVGGVKFVRSSILAAKSACDPQCKTCVAFWQKEHPNE